MAILPIRTFPDPVLRTRAREVESITDDHRLLVKNMIDTMRDAPGVGLAAPQIGVLERIFVWEVDEEYGAVVNPVIVERSEQVAEDEEGCLSLPGLVFPVVRNERVVVEGRDESGQAIRIEGSDLLGRVFQHEIDHLDGVLFTDRLPETLKREAMSVLREQALGFASTRQPPPPVEERL